MKTIELSEVSALAPHVQSGSHEPVILTQNGHAVAAILPVDECDVENLLLSINPQFQAILDRSERRLKSEGLVSSADVRTRLGLSAKDQRARPSSSTVPLARKIRVAQVNLWQRRMTKVPSNREAASLLVNGTISVVGSE
jgi:antitoxin (DNA-binding transcriptional repressor) of toxin-antitoxin stability system